jgi:uncharacterized alkaline shock family protein YloU
MKKRNFFENVIDTSKKKFKNIFGCKTYALIGKSGTGKSYNAYMTSYSLDINTIIDDGLLISRGKIIAGRSAKRANTKVGAVKRAIFYDDEHAEEVKYYIKKLKIKKCLILGTSIKMINRIIAKLDLSPPVKIINIEDIASTEDIKKAQFHRLTEGKHVLPVPEMEILNRYSDLFVHNIQLSINGEKSIIEKSVLRPTFSLNGGLKISKKVYRFYLFKIIEVNFPNVKINMFHIKEQNDGLIIHIEIGIRYGENFFHLSERMQKRLKSDFEFFTGRELLKINIKVNEVIENV